MDTAERRVSPAPAVSAGDLVLLLAHREAVALLETEGGAPPGDWERHLSGPERAELEAFDRLVAEIRRRIRFQVRLREGAPC